MDEVTRILAYFATKVETLRTSNPRLPMQALLMTVEGRAALLESQEQLAGALCDLLDEMGTARRAG